MTLEGKVWELHHDIIKRNDNDDDMRGQKSSSLPPSFDAVWKQKSSSLPPSFDAVWKYDQITFGKVANYVSNHSAQLVAEDVL